MHSAGLKKHSVRSIYDSRLFGSAASSIKKWFWNSLTGYWCTYVGQGAGWLTVRSSQCSLASSAAFSWPARQINSATLGFLARHSFFSQRLPLRKKNVKGRKVTTASFMVAREKNWERVITTGFDHFEKKKLQFWNDSFANFLAYGLVLSSELVSRANMQRRRGRKSQTHACRWGKKLSWSSSCQGVKKKERAKVFLPRSISAAKHYPGELVLFKQNKKT